MNYQELIGQVHDAHAAYVRNNQQLQAEAIKPILDKMCDVVTFEPVAIHSATQVTPDRTMIAAMAMQGIAASNEYPPMGLNHSEKVAEFAVKYADALITELAKPTLNTELKKAGERLKTLAAETNGLKDLGLSTGYLTSLRVAAEDMVILTEQLP